MGNIFLQYMSNRMGDEKKPEVKTGKVITISREAGCGAYSFAELLAKTINNIYRKSDEPEWVIINKEKLKEAGKQLNLKPEQIDKVFTHPEKSSVDDIIGAISSKYYKNDKVVRKIVKQMIRDFAEKGNIIIIGRASEIITHDMPKALHVNLYAELKWRAEQISKRYNISIEEATKKASEADINRKAHRDDFVNDAISHDFYDVMINSQNISKNAMINILIEAAKEKNIL